MASPHDDPPHDDPPQDDTRQVDPRHVDRGPSRRRKSADAFRTISEVSEEVGVPQHVLRFWETKFSQIKPLKRGGGRRYYRPEDIELLNRIRAWLYDDGYTIKGVQKLLREGGAAAVSAPGRAAAAADRAPAGAGSRASAAPAGPEKVRALPVPPVLRPPDNARDDAVPAGETSAAAGRASAIDEDGYGRNEAGAAGASEPASADRIAVERVSLEGLVESLEEIRDKLRGPPPEP